MISHSFVSLLNRRGVWMTPVEIYDASPDYPVGDYVIADLLALKVNGLIVSRQRRGSSLMEYGLPSWLSAPEPAFSFSYFLFTLNRLLRHLLAAA